MANYITIDLKTLEERGLKFEQIREMWRDETGDKALYALLTYALELKKKLGE